MIDYQAYQRRPNSESPQMKTMKTWGNLVINNPMYNTIRNNNDVNRSRNNILIVRNIHLYTNRCQTPVVHRQSNNNFNTINIPSMNNNYYLQTQNNNYCPNQYPKKMNNIMTIPINEIKNPSNNPHYDIDNGMNNFNNNNNNINNGMNNFNNNNNNQKNQSGKNKIVFFSGFKGNNNNINSFLYENNNQNINGQPNNNFRYSLKENPRSDKCIRDSFRKSINTKKSITNSINSKGEEDTDMMLRQAGFSGNIQKEEFNIKRSYTSNFPGYEEKGETTIAVDQITSKNNNKDGTTVIAVNQITSNKDNENYTDIMVKDFIQKKDERFNGRKINDHLSYKKNNVNECAMAGNNPGSFPNNFNYQQNGNNNGMYSPNYNYNYNY